MGEAKLIGYLDFGFSKNDELTFERPVFICDNKMYWLDFRESIEDSNHDYDSFFVKLDSIYESKIKYINLDYSMPYNDGLFSGQLYLVRLGDNIICGKKDEISKSIFGKYEPLEIKNYDKDLSLLYFLIYNYDDDYLNKYLNVFGDNEFLLIAKNEFSKTHLSYFHKVFLRKIVNQKLNVNIDFDLEVPTVEKVIDFLIPAAYELHE